MNGRRSTTNSGPGPTPATVVSHGMPKINTPSATELCRLQLTGLESGELAVHHAQTELIA